jgi:hypothetical protein
MKELIAIQKALHVPKDQRGHNYKYRKVDDIISEVKRIAPDNVYLVLSDDIINIGDRNYIKSTATIFNGQMSIHATGCAWEPDKLPGQVSPQITGSCATYARKKALDGLFALDDTEDDDPDSLIPTIGENKVEPVKLKGITPQQTKTLKDFFPVLEKLGSGGANKAITVIDMCLGSENVSFEDAAGLIGRVQATIKGANNNVNRA